MTKTGTGDQRASANTDTAITDLLNAGYRYALSLCANKADAEDYTHDAWLRAWQRYGKTVDKNLLFTIVRHLFIDQCRRNTRKATAEDELLDLSGQELDEADMRGEFADLQRHLLELRPVEREALYLNAVEGYTAREIALLTETPRSTVLSLLARSRAKLRAMMQGSTDVSENRESV